MFKQALLTLAVLASVSATAVEIAGQNIADTAKVAGSDVVLNGGGIRTKFGVAKVYVGALYVAQKNNDAAAVINASTPRRMQISMLRKVAAEDLHASLIDALEENSSSAEFASFAGKIKEMNAIFASAKEVKEGDIITLDFIPGKGTQIAVRGQMKDVIAGDDFARALLKIWLGNKPVSGDLKKSLLGK